MDNTNLKRFVEERVVRTYRLVDMPLEEFKQAVDEAFEEELGFIPDVRFEVSPHNGKVGVYFNDQLDEKELEETLDKLGMDPENRIYNGERLCKLLDAWALEITEDDDDKYRILVTYLLDQMREVKEAERIAS